MLSIIIPTKNEEDNLPTLLESIKNQKFSDYEVIVADAGSSDETLAIAKKFSCKITAGGLPPRGRNRGAAIAQGEFFLFLDADVVLPANFLQKTLSEFKKRNLAAASFCLCSKDAIGDSALGIFYNLPSKISEKIIPQAMTAVLVKSEIHRAIGGFNEKIKLGEEVDYIRRAKRAGRCGLIKSTGLFVSLRRFKKDGWLATWVRYFLCQLHMLFLGPVESDIFQYKFNHYEKTLQNERKN
jgi:glycosyltransferase involved in cell wall biosynthesis